MTPDLYYWNVLSLGLGVWLLLAFGLAEWLLGGILVIGIAVVAVTAVAVYKSLRLPRTLVVDVVTPNANDIPSEVREEWETSDVELSRDGFQCMVRARIGDPSEPTVTYNACWGVPGTSFTLESSVITTADGKSLAVIRSVQTLGTNKQHLETSASRPFQPSPPIRSLGLAFFGSLWEWEPLIRAHKARLARWSSRPAEVYASISDEQVLQNAQAVHENLCRALVAEGYLRGTAGAGGFRPTLRGCLLWMTYHLPVLKWIRLSVQRARNAALLESLGLQSQSSRFSHWLAVSVGIAAIGYGTTLPGGLPIACSAYVGMAVARAIVRRHARSLRVRHVLFGAFVSITLFSFLGFAFLFTQSLLGFWTGVRVAVSVTARELSLWAFVAAFAGGPAALLWGWARIPYLRPLPVRQPLPEVPADREPHSVHGKNLRRPSTS